jgi:hypothetical protein
MAAGQCCLCGNAGKGFIADKGFVFLDDVLCVGGHIVIYGYVI